MVRPRDGGDLRGALEELRGEVERLRSEVAELRATADRRHGETSIRIAGVEQGLDRHESRLVHLERRSTAHEVALASIEAAIASSPTMEPAERLSSRGVPADA